jgi:3-oxoacyl-[acyl-carrier protein] reductase
MSDKYLELINSPFGKNVASRLGLPQPAVLRRYSPDAPLVPGPLLLGAVGTGLKGLAEVLTGAGVDVQIGETESQKLSALVLDATAASVPADLAQLRDFFVGSLRRVHSSGRVVIIGRAPDGEDPAVDATRQALDGIVRSLAKEMRAGATANLVLVDGEADGSTVEGALRFFLSGRSAFVDGQVLRVSSADAPAPVDWTKPLAGKVAVVTGAARGIGAAIARVLARAGASVVVADLPAAGESLAKVANTIGGTALQLDVTSPDAPEQLIGFVTGRFGGVDIVIHNAGITRDKLLANMKPEAWDSVIAVNLQSQLRVNAALLSAGAVRPGGRVVCLASTSGIAGNRGQTNYAASKAGVIGMVRASAAAFAKHGATINAVAPGFIDTDMTHAIPFATREVARRLSSLRQAGLPVDVAEAIAFMCQSAAGGVNGQVLRVCGQNLVGA